MHGSRMWVSGFRPVGRANRIYNQDLGKQASARKPVGAIRVIPAGDLRVLAGAISAISAISAGPFSDSKTATASFLAGPCYTPSGMPCLVHGRLCTSQDRAFCAVTLGLAFARLDEGDVGPLRARDRRMPTRLPRCHVNRLALLGELGIVNQSCPRAPACQLADAAFRSSWRSRARSRARRHLAMLSLGEELVLM